VAPRGTISVTPGDESSPEVLTKKVTDKTLQMLVRKLAAAASAPKNKSKKHLREQEEDAEERPIKRRKSEPEPLRHKPKVTKTYSSFLKKSRRMPSPELVEKRGRGRPRLPSPKRVSQSKIKAEERLAEAGKSVSAQPRTGNGRFGRKDKSARKSDESASSSHAHENGYSASCEGSADRDVNDQRATRTSPRRKRANDDVEELEESPRKRAAAVEEQVEEPTAALRVLPRPVSGFRGGRLFSNPNPLQFALHAWSGPVVLDDSSSEDEKHPETPEDDQSSVVDVAGPEDEPIYFPSLTLARGSLTLKPTPFSFAKSRWNGPSASLGHVVRKKPPPLDTSSVEVRSFATYFANLRLLIPSLQNHSLDQDIVLSPLSDDGYVSPFSDDNVFPHKLRHTYPVLQPPSASASNSYIPKSTAFPSLNLGTTPTFISAGWDDASDASEA
jgi:histone-lysine N-methyltransferase SUV420H